MTRPYLPLGLARIALLALLAVLVLVAPAAPARADDGDRPGAVVADLGLHVVNAGYQRALGPRVTVQATAGLYVPWVVNRDVLGLGGGRDGAVTVAGLVARGRAFFHPLGGAPAGLWISPFVQAGGVRAPLPAGPVDGPTFAVGASVGWAWRLGPRWLFAAGLGAQYHRATLGGSTEAPGFSRLGPTADINVAYRL